MVKAQTATIARDKAIKRLIQARKRSEGQVEKEDQDYLRYKKELEGND